MTSLLGKGKSLIFFTVYSGLFSVSVRNITTLLGKVLLQAAFLQKVKVFTSSILTYAGRVETYN